MNKLKYSLIFITLLSISLAQNSSITIGGSGTDAVQLTVGTTAEQPGTPTAGMIRFNSTTSKFEGYTGSAWVNLH